MSNLEYNIYVLAELAYKDEHLDIKEDELYPGKWYEYTDYREKTEIIADAIKRKKLIKDTDMYRAYVESKAK